MPNLAEAPIHRLEDRRAVLQRILEALQRDPDCRYVFREKLNPDEEANWEARNDVQTALREFPKILKEESIPSGEDSTHRPLSPDCSCDTQLDNQEETRV